MKAIVRVPTKITVFGEHAVVYGKPAIAVTIPRFILVTLTPRNDSKIEVHTHGVSARLSSIVLERDSNNVISQAEPADLQRIVNYIITALNLCEDLLKEEKKHGYNVEVRSELPPSIGLGTSAAVSVGVVAACFALHGEDPLKRRGDVAMTAWRTEYKVQGAASPMDTFTVTFGGLRYIEPKNFNAQEIVYRGDLPLVVGYTPRHGTTAELVAKVRSLRSRAPLILNKIMDLIGEVVEEARRTLEKRDLEELGLLMNVNHGLLSSLGVVNEVHDRIVHVLRRAGALGAKTSGAGGGGAFVALASSSEDSDRLAKLITGLEAVPVATQIWRRGFEVLEY
ncbi:MAG: mevalonate kinase [Thermoprotei archaeon]|nr:MAG: mevalonate kinase [Thermoprotei archaeon]